MLSSGSCCQMQVLANLSLLLFTSSLLPQPKFCSTALKPDGSSVVQVKQHFTYVEGRSLRIALRVVKLVVGRLTKLSEMNDQTNSSS